jgi:hypothetical protein|tara:strand:+ start:365 stop:655 length:291 start_codon:yes stop_codon:yes gene_type:complete
MSDFIDFVEVDIHDQVRDNILLDEADVQIKNITQNSVFTRVQLRRYLVKYFPERVHWTGIHPVFNETMERDIHRYYWTSKMAKDFIIMTGKETFTY